MVESRLLTESLSFDPTADAWAKDRGLLDFNGGVISGFPAIIGMPDGSTDLGAFNIGIIQSNRTIKQALQDLETAASTRLVTTNNLSDVANKAAGRSNLELGSAATWNVGTTGAVIPLLSTDNTFTGAQTFTGGVGSTNGMMTYPVSGTTNAFPTLGDRNAQTSALYIANATQVFGMLIGVDNNGSTWFQSQRVDNNTAVYNLNFNPMGGDVAIGKSGGTSNLYINGFVAYNTGNFNPALYAPIAGNFTFTGPVFFAGSPSFYLALDSGNPIINFTPGSFLEYNSSSNFYTFGIAGAGILTVSATAVSSGRLLNVTGDINSSGNGTFSGGTLTITANGIESFILMNNTNVVGSTSLRIGQGVIGETNGGFSIHDTGNNNPMFSIFPDRTGRFFNTLTANFSIGVNVPSNTGNVAYFNFLVDYASNGYVAVDAASNMFFNCNGPIFTFQHVGSAIATISTTVADFGNLVIQTKSAASIGNGVFIDSDNSATGFLRYTRNGGTTESSIATVNGGDMYFDSITGVYNFRDPVDNVLMQLSPTGVSFGALPITSVATIQSSDIIIAHGAGTTGSLTFEAGGSQAGYLAFHGNGDGFLQSLTGSFQFKGTGDATFATIASSGANFGALPIVTNGTITSNDITIAHGPGTTGVLTFSSGTVVSNIQMAPGGSMAFTSAAATFNFRGQSGTFATISSSGADFSGLPMFAGTITGASSISSTAYHLNAPSGQNGFLYFDAGGVNQGYVACGDGGSMYLDSNGGSFIFQVGGTNICSMGPGTASFGAMNTTVLSLHSSGAIVTDTGLNVGTELSVGGDISCHTLHSTGDLTVGDVHTSRPDGSGVLYLGNAGNHYLYFDGTTYTLPIADLTVNGGVVWTGATFNPNLYANLGASVNTFAGSGSFAGTWGTPIDSIGGVVLTRGGTGNAGYLAFYEPGGTRNGYIGNSTVGGPLQITNERTAGFTMTGGKVTVEEFASGSWIRCLSNGVGLYWEGAAQGIIAAAGNTTYGNVCTYGTGSGSWSGYAVGTWITLMSNGSTQGLFSVTSGLWLVQWVGADATFAGNVTAFSDERLKHNKRPIDNVTKRREGMAKAAILYERDGETRVGFGAQTLELSNPEVVFTADDLPGTKSVNYGDIVAVLAADNQNLADRLAVVETKLTEALNIINSLSNGM